MQTSEVFNAAADHIQVYGHRKAGLGEIGQPTCAIGALMVVADGSTDYDRNKWYPAGNALREYLGGDVSIHRWNNAPERTGAEVIEVLRACAVIEQSRERQPAEAVLS